MLAIKGVTKTFYKDTQNEKRVLRDINLNLKNGDFVTIIGSNGAGKSTLLNCISGTHGVDSGTISLDEKDITASPEYERAGYIGRVFQNPLMGTCGEMTVYENMAIALKRGKKSFLKSGMKERRVIAQALEVLEAGFENRLDDNLSLLSGGQRQAVSLLMATINTPRLLLLDEHTSALDPKAAEKILSLTSKIVSDKKITAVMITHNMSDAIKYGNRLIMMNDGKIIFEAKDQEKSKLTKDVLLKKFSESCLSDRMILEA